MADEMTRQEFTDYMTAFEKRLDTRFSKIDERFAEMEGHFGDLKQSMKIQFEDVRRDLRFSFEAVQGLREVTDRGFEDQRTEHREQISLLHDVLHHVRGRVERLEPRPRKRRS